MGPGAQGLSPVLSGRGHRVKSASGSVRVQACSAAFCFRALELSERAGPAQAFAVRPGQPPHTVCGRAAPPPPSSNGARRQDGL